MMRIARLMGTMGAVLALCACASAPMEPAPELDRVQAQEAEAPLVPMPVPMANPVKEERKKTKKEIMADIRQALKNNTSDQGDCSYEEGARAVCPWFDGHLYTMYVKKGGTNSLIYMNPDEKIVYHNLDRDEYFTTKVEWAGSKEGEKDLVRVQAWLPGAKTKLTILTTRREYQIMLITNHEDYNPGMRFVYPEQMTQGLEAPPERNVPVEDTTNIPLDKLNMKYTASGQIGELRGEQLRIFDDGKRTYVIFPEGVSARPPYFGIKSGDGENVEMIPDPKGHYIIRGIYRDAELQVGDDIIKIRRGR